LSRTSSDVSDSGRVASIPPRDPSVQHFTPPVSPKSKQETMENKEAAELMMFLATSPSPARKTAVKHDIPPAAARILFQRPADLSGKQPQSTLERERTLIVENDYLLDSSQASTATMVDPSLPLSKSDTQSTIPFPLAASSSQSQYPKFNSSSNFTTGGRLLNSPLPNGPFHTSQEYQLESPPNISLNGLSLTGGLSTHSSSRNQYSPNKVPTRSLGAGINLTT